MRKLVWVALAALLCFFFLLFILDSGKTANAPQNDGGSAQPAQGDVHVGILSAQVADFENGRVAVIRGFLLSPDDSAPRVSAFCSGAPIQKNALILKHQAVAGVDSSLSEKLSFALARQGLSTRQILPEDALAAENAIIFLPTGALPLALSESLGSLRARNNRIVLLEMISGKMIDENGSLSALPGNLSGLFEKVRLEIGQGEEAARHAAEAALLPPNADAVDALLEDGNFTLVVPLNGTDAYCRILYFGKAAWRFADTGGLFAQKGRLLGAGEVPAGERATFEFSFISPDEKGRNLSFFAVLKNAEGEVARQKIAGGEMNGEIGSGFAFTFQNRGKYVVDVVDQFGRMHASAYTEAVGLAIEQASQEGGRYQFRLLSGDKPLEGAVEAWIDEGSRKTYYATNGTLVVWAAPAPGNHEMHFAKGALLGSYPFIAQGSGLLERYVQLGVPAMLFLLAIYFLLRAGKKMKYRITFPQFAPEPQKLVPASEWMLEAAWEAADEKMGGFCLAHYPEEIAQALPMLLGEKGAANPQSVLCALMELSGRGVFCESDGAFVPVKRMRGFAAAELRVLRLLHDVLLERGIPFERKRCFPVGRQEEVSLFSGKESVLLKIGKRHRLVIFEDEPALAAFEKSLEDEGMENTRIKLAKSLGKIAFATSTRNELERHLP